MFTVTRFIWVPAAGALLIAGDLAACGSATAGHKIPHAHPAAAQPSVSSPGSGGVVARVGGYPITEATFQRQLEAALKSEPASSRLNPPAFKACVAHLEAISPASPEPGSSVPAAPNARKKQCESEYQNLRREVLDQLISGRWVINGAKELGVAVSVRVVRRNIDAYKHRNYPTEAQYQHYLQGLGRTPGDQSFKAEVELDSEAIRREINRRVGPITMARVARYYTHHKELYFVSERRDLEIVRTTTEATALVAKQEIAAGMSFASVVKRLGIPQPIYSKAGLVRGYKSGNYAQKRLNEAILTAKPGQLSGPVKISLGYYVFKVNQIIPPSQKPLAEVAVSLKRQLPARLRQQALMIFIAKWRSRWIARTDCRPHYVVRKCRQFKASRTTPPEDPYTID